MAGENETTGSVSPRRRTIGLLLGPVLFVIMLACVDLAPGQPMVTRTAAAALLIAVFWITEALPIPVTSLLPLVLFPLMKVMKTSDAAAQYINSTILLFMGGFMLALAIERWQLHRRLALAILTVIGDRRSRVVLGVMVATAAISMWVSNTATAMMMLPIALAIIAHSDTLPGDARQKENFALVLMLAVAYASSIGGIGTIVGTPPNLAFVRIFSIAFPKAPPVSFTGWLLMALPLVVVFTLVAWLVMTKLLVPVSGARIAGGRGLLRAELRQMGPLSPAEKRVAVVFVLTALLWITRSSIDLGSVKFIGWGERLGLGSFVDDATVAIGMAVLLFFIPASSFKGERLLDWPTALRLPWGVLLLFGGGFALAEAFQQSGLSEWLGNRLGAIGNAPVWLMIVEVSVLMTFLSEVTSNTAITQLILPILAALSVSMHINPLLLMLPATISASCAFMLPVGTPPNAIIYGSGRVPIAKMAAVGLVLNFIGVVLVLMLMLFVAEPLFHIFGVMPDWAAN